MNVNELAAQAGYEVLNPEAMDERDIESGYVGDLLSWVMANASSGCAWVTIQTHLNIVAVATLLDMACIIIPEGAEVERDTLEKATVEGIPILSTQANAFEVCAYLGSQGIK